MVEPSTARLRLGARGQEVDELGSEPELHQRDALVHVVERAAEDLGIEAPRDLLVPHAENDVVEPEGLKARHGRRATSRTTKAMPASITAPFRMVDSR